MDYNYGNGDYNQDFEKQTPRNTDQGNNGLSTAALVLGILSIVTVCCILGSFIFGGIAIILALLSRGYDKTLNANAKLGIILSIIGIVLGIILTILATISLIAYSSTDEFNQILQEYENYDQSVPYNTEDYESYFNIPDTL